MGNRQSTQQRSRACYFSRDLQKGSRGGDVFCLQEFLKREGLLDEASGYFGEQTAQAVAAWQDKNKLGTERGVFGQSTRQEYAKRMRLLVPGGPPTAAEKAEGSVTGIEVCSELENKKVCKVGLARSAEEMPHGCKQACQLAYAEVCERMYPTNQKDGGLDYRKCMQLMHTSCSTTCAGIERERPK